MMTESYLNYFAGPLVKKLISDWSAKATDKLTPPERKIFVYSGHDSTVSNLLLALGTWDQQVPNYGIMVIFELYENLNTNEFGVEVTTVQSNRIKSFFNVTTSFLPKNLPKMCLELSYLLSS